MKSLKKTMFREYDIRGKVSDEELNEESISRIAVAYTKFLKKRKIRKAILGYDYRDVSEEIHDVVLKSLLEGGIDVVDIGMCLTPMMYMAQYHFRSRAGVMITASHNPNGWSGFKLASGYSTTLGPDGIKEIYHLALKNKVSFSKKGKKKGKLEKEEFLPAYADDVLKRVKLRKKLKVVVNTGNGTAGPIATYVLEKFGVDVIPLYTELNWSFPHYFPNPSLVMMMEDTGVKVRQERANIGIAIDGDGDRVGVTDEKGNTVWPDRFMILLARQTLEKNPRAKIIFDVKSSKALEEDIEAHGGVPIMAKTGHSYIKARMQEEKAPLAGEMSGHIFYNKPMYYGFDDGIFAALKLIEYLSLQDDSFSKLLTDAPSYVSSPALQVSCPDERKYQVVESLTKEFKKEGYDVITISGARVNFNSGWGLVRASSNLPVLGLRFEAMTEEKLQEIMGMFRQKLSKFPEVGEKWESG